MRAIFLLLLAFHLLIGCKSQNEGVSKHSSSDEYIELVNSQCKITTAVPERLTLQKLISSPDSYDGKVVVVSGYFYGSFERMAIYPHAVPDSGSYAKQGIWVEGVAVRTPIFKRPMTLSGVFSSKDNGHSGQWPGTICVYTARSLQKI